ncbi:MAG: ABC transporter permease [Oscillospiraceae bacterium]|jgi:multidrug/hemolysin transport system permease protein|nr:ABC transporter permease [Oscillospiraceae bacterium]
MTSHITILARRSIVLFLRDKTAVFFSFLSSLIIVALYVLFIGKTYSAGLMEESSFFAGNAGSYLVYLQMIAGVMAVNSLSLSIGAFSTIAKDFETRRVDSFLITPIKVSRLIAAYFFGGFIASFVLNCVTWIAAFALIGGLTAYWVTAVVFVKVIAILVFASFMSSSIMLLITSLLKSTSAISVFMGVSGTFIGFLCGVYMPFSMLGKTVEKIGSVIPFTHVSVWFKRVILSGAFEQIKMPSPLNDMVLDSFSASNVGFVSLDIPLWGMLLYCAAFALICLFAAWNILRRRIGK